MSKQEGFEKDGTATADGIDPQRPSGAPPKYRVVYDELREAIRAERYRPGDRLPSEAELGRHFGASRITVAKAVRALQTQGLVSRRAGSGTHVLPAESGTGQVFGLLIPDLGRTEIFEPICRGIMQAPEAKGHSLLWGHMTGRGANGEEEAEALCSQYIAQRVDGVFLAPLEFMAGMDGFNERLVRRLESAGIHIVLLDRCFAPQPMRSKYDLVGIDNRRAGYIVTLHLLRLGATRIAFVARPYSASTVTARTAGYREALYDYRLAGEDLVRRGDPDDPDFVQALLRDCRPDAIVCANDLTAARMMTTLLAAGVAVPEQVRIVGFDDVKYAGLLPVPLTTQHQDCTAIGSTALTTMLRRIKDPDAPTQDVFLQTHTVVRRSCGAHLPPRLIPG